MLMTKKGLYAFNGTWNSDEYTPTEQTNAIRINQLYARNVTDAITRFGKFGRVIGACSGLVGWGATASMECMANRGSTPVRKIKVDLGVTNEILDDISTDNLVPLPSVEGSYLKDAEFTRNEHIVGKIIYNDKSIRSLIHLKNTTPENVSFKAKGYKAQNPNFPDQTPADQFFDTCSLKRMAALPSW